MIDILFLQNFTTKPEKNSQNSKFFFSKFLKF